MGNEWRERLFGELTENLDSIRVPVKEADRRPGPYPYYGASGVVDHVDGYLFDGEYLLIAEDGENLRTRTTPVAFMARDKFWVNNHAHIVRGNSEADTRFLMYALAASDISGYLTGSTMPKLTQGNMNRIPILAPPLSEQRAIAHILGTLDDKIELNRRMSETLESIARALFQSWFVDFDPVRAKSEGRDPGLPKPVADLFPGAFEDSELGEIPQGWRVAGLAEVAKLVTETISPGAEPERCWEHYSIPAYDEGRRPSRDLGSSIKSNKYRVPPTSILVSKLNPQFPRVWCPEVRDTGGAVCSTEFMPFVPRKPGWRAWLYSLATSAVFQAAIADRVTGSTGSRQRVAPREIASLPLTLPPEILLDRFARTIAPALDSISLLQRESETLAETREALLPRLISGELKVPFAERPASAAP